MDSLTYLEIFRADQQRRDAEIELRRAARERAAETPNAPRLRVRRTRRPRPLRHVAPPRFA